MCGLIEDADGELAAGELVSGVGEVGQDALNGVFEVFEVWFEVFQNFYWRQSKQKQMPNEGVTEMS